MVRKQIKFYGRVQGVGFRYHAKNAAVSLGLTGFVRNESDGSVFMEVQGHEIQIEKMLQFLNRDMYIDIQKLDMKKVDLIEDEKSFIVAY